ncbi:MAG: hypothetical protein F9K24_11570 [Leptonema illini]|jgi:hypothetical protein|uniref:Uncharacterized protein n=1 Tax=Leptonema illini TaxID=183 RepID=A0A833H153_9LEPT|nr:MAG: hypothetical protein F9K24_11570 [Leptonema illini]
MEWLLLLLLGSLAAGTVYWTASSRPSDEKKEPDGEGPRSSPELPERRERAPVVDVKSDIDKFREFLSKAPEPIRPDVVDTKEKSAKDAAEELRKELRRKKKPLKVTFSTDQIIPRSSPHAFHRRPLQSAEQFVEQQLADEALHLYERVDRRVENEEINRKIRTNIEDIRRWMEGLDGDDDEPLTFPEIIIPLTTQALALESLSEGLRKISETLSRDIASALREDGALRAELRQGAPPRMPPIPPEQTEPGPQGYPEGTPGAVAPTGYAPAGGAPSPASPGAPSIGTGTPAPQALQGYPGPAGGAAPTTPQGYPATMPGTGGRRIYVAPPPVTMQGDAEAGVPGITVFPQVAPVGPGVTTGPADYFRHAREDFKFDEQGRLITDGRTDEDFEEQWEKYRMLPLSDRRAGDERRRPEDETDERIDRRSREDRRKNDLFLERDEFLDSWKRHEERKRMLEQRGIAPVPDADIIIAPFPYQEGAAAQPYSEPIGLPDADEHPLDRALEEAGSLVDQIHTEIHAGGAPSPEDLPSLELPGAEYEGVPEREYHADRPAGADTRVELVPPVLDSIKLPEAGDMPASDLMPSTDGASKIEIVEQPLGALHLPDPESIPGMPPAEAAETPAGRDEDYGPGRPPEKPEQAEAETKTQEESFGEGVEAADIPEMPELPEERGPVQEIRGVLELKPPDEDDAPFLTLTYDFSKIPDSFKLSRDYHTMEFVYYKYKPMLIKAQEFARRKMLKSALNYYRVIKSQNIPPEFRRMVNRNIQDITDYLEKFMMSRSGD